MLVHVTPTNALLWNTGTTPSTSIEHGVIDPGHRFQGVEAAAVAVVNEPARRGRAVGADLLPVLAASAPVDPMLRRKMLWVTVVTFAIWLSLCALIIWGGLTVRDLDIWRRM